MQMLHDLSYRFRHSTECMHECNGHSLVELDPFAEVSSCFGHALLFITEFLTFADSEVSDNFTIGQLRKANTGVMLHHSCLADGQHRHTTVDVHFGTPEVHEVVGAHDPADHFSISTC